MLAGPHPRSRSLAPSRSAAAAGAADFTFGINHLHLSTAGLVNFAYSPHGTPWLRARVFAVLEHLRAVDEYVLHANGVLVRLLERRLVSDLRRVEHDDIGKHPFANEAAVLELEVRGRKSGEL